MCLLIKSRSFYLPAVEDKTPSPPPAPSPLPVTGAIRRHAYGWGLGGAKGFFFLPPFCSPVFSGCSTHSTQAGCGCQGQRLGSQLRAIRFYQQDHTRSSVQLHTYVCHIMRDRQPTRRQPLLLLLLLFSPIWTHGGEFFNWKKTQILPKLSMLPLTKQLYIFPLWKAVGAH